MSRPAHAHLRSRQRIATPVAILAFSTASTFVGPRVGAQTPIPVHAYTIHSTTVPASPDTPAAAPSPSSAPATWTGSVITTAGRGRMDVADATPGGLFTTGDYVLFDSVGLVVVHPHDKTFIIFPTDYAARTVAMAKAAGADITFADVAATLDSTGPGEPVAGTPTRHARLAANFRIAMTIGPATQLSQSIRRVYTTDYWLAANDSLPPNTLGLLTSDARSMAALIGDAGSPILTAASGMPRGMTLKMVTLAQRTDPAGVTTATTTTTERSAMHASTIGPAALVLPADYTEAQFPGLPPIATTSTSAADAAAKWRAPPSR